MDVLLDFRAIRRDNLEGLIASLDGGNMAAFADRVDTPPAYLSQIRNRTRQMGDKLARKIEAKLGKGQGWMDLPQFKASEATLDQLEVAQIVGNLDKVHADMILAVARQINDLYGKKTAAAPFAGVPKPAADPDPRTSAGAAAKVAADTEPKKRRRRKAGRQ